MPGLVVPKYTLYEVALEAAVQLSVGVITTPVAAAAGDGTEALPGFEDITVVALPPVKPLVATQPLASVTLVSVNTWPLVGYVGLDAKPTPLASPFAVILPEPLLYIILKGPVPAVAVQVKAPAAPEHSAILIEPCGLGLTVTVKLAELVLKQPKAVAART